MTETLKAEDQRTIAVLHERPADVRVASTSFTCVLDFGEAEPSLTALPLRRSTRRFAAVDDADRLQDELSAWDAASDEALARFEDELSE